MTGTTRWLAWALFAGGTTLAAVGLVFLVLSLDQPTDSFGFRGAAAVLTVAIGAVGLVIARARPENPIGWILLVSDLFWGIQALSQDYAIYALLERGGEVPGGAIAGWLDTWAWAAPIGALTIYVPLLFPTGRLISPRWRIVMIVGTVGIVGMSVATALEPGSIQTTETVANPFAVDMPPEEFGPFVGLAGLPLIAGIFAAAASLVVRYRRGGVEERQQIKWLAVGAFLTAGSLVAVAVSEATGGTAGDVVEIAVTLCGATIPAAAAVAILKYRLYDIDVVINRAVVFGLLGAFITAMYVAIVVGVGALVGRRGGIVLPGVAAAVVALAFQPLRDRARHLANVLVYGRRATPYEVLSEFAERLAGGYSIDDVLPRMARLLGEGTAAERAGVWLRVGDELRRAAAWPRDDAEPERVPLPDGRLGAFPGDRVAFPVTHQGELLGALTVEKPRSEPLAPAEEKLIGDLAGQAGLVLRNVRLTEELKANLEELRASRQRIVAAQDDERRRIERNIHDGAQQQLVAMRVRLRLAQTLAAKDPPKAERMLEQLQGEMADALENLRDLARGIYPPLLADAGLAAALEAQARKASVRVDVDAVGVGRYPQDVEAAVYFCVLEAVQNASKYAGEAQVRVRLLQQDDELAFAVEDDGSGFDVATTPRGSGLQNMADRIEALGGSLEIRSARGKGTTVAGRVPAQPAEVAVAQASSRRSGSNSDLGM